MPGRPFVILGSKKVNDNSSNDNSDRQNDVCDYMNISSLEIDISFVLIMMAFAFQLKLMTVKQTILHRKGLFYYFMATTGYYLLTTFILM